MQIRIDKFTMQLEEEPLDIGYASEKVKLKDTEGKELTVGGQNGATQLFISLPVIDSSVLEELKAIDATIPDFSSDKLDVNLVVANDSHSDPQFKNLRFLVDSHGEFGDWYGVRMVGEPYNHEFAKALIIVSKDGALFYDEFVSDLALPFNTDTLYRKILAAQQTYTGKGCH